MSPDPDVRGRAGDAVAAPGHTTGEGTAELVMPLAEEVLRVGKRSVETATVRISLSTETVEEVVRQALLTRTAEIERVPIGREVSAAPQPRREGDVLVIPVVEEVLVVEKRLVLREELRLRMVEGEEVVEQVVARRVQRATVERIPVEKAASPPARADGRTDNLQETPP